MTIARRSPAEHAETKLESSLWQGSWPQSVADFSRLVDAFKNRIVRHAFRRLGDLHLAEDAAQEAFVRTYEARMRLSNVANVSAYLYRVCSNICTDAARKRERLSIDADDAALDSARAKGPAAPEALSAREELSRIESILSRIPDEQAEVIRLRVLDELPFVDIATLTASPLATVKSRFRYGLEKVREKLGKGQEAEQ